MSLATGLLLTGCHVGIKPSGSGNVDRTWPISANSAFAPDAIRIHPLTRLARDRDTGRLYVEAHVELLDRWKHGVKALGEIRFELYELTGTRGKEQLSRWVRDLSDPEQNSDAYDRVTHTYRFALIGIESNIEPARTYELEAYFTPLGGQALQTWHRFGSR